MEGTRGLPLWECPFPERELNGRGRPKRAALGLSAPDVTRYLGRYRDRRDQRQDGDHDAGDCPGMCAVQSAPSAFG